MSKRVLRAGCQLIFLSQSPTLLVQRVSACGKASKYFKSLSDERLSNFDMELTLIRLQADLLCLVRDVPIGSSGRTVVEEMQGQPSIMHRWSHQGCSHSSCLVFSCSGGLQACRKPDGGPSAVH